jgi:DNA-binding transcriptional MocR family regulator
MQRNVAMLGPAMAEVFGWKFIQPLGSMYIMFRHTEASDLDAVIRALKRGVGVAGGSMFFEHDPVNTGFIRVHVGLDEARVAKVCETIRGQ